MKVLVIGGMHGNEPLGIELVKLINEKPIDNLEAIIANTEAVTRNVRFTGKDLNRSFPGSKDGNNFEDRRAEELISRSEDFDIVLDFHNTHCPDNDCSFIGISSEEKLLSVSSFLELNRVVVADYDCINKYAGNCISIEISLDSSLNNPELWYKKLKDLTETNTLPRPNNLSLYSFAYRISLEDKEELNLENKKLKAFKPIDPNIARSLGFKDRLYPIFVADKYTPYNYGGLLKDYNRLRR